MKAETVNRTTIGYFEERLVLRDYDAGIGRALQEGLKSIMERRVERGWANKGEKRAQSGGGYSASLGIKAPNDPGGVYKSGAALREAKEGGGQGGSE